MIREIRVECIVPSNFLSLRVETEEGDEFVELMSSIERVGLIEPITVRALRSKGKPLEKGMYEIICGHRRYAACKKLHFERIACQVVEIDDREAFEVALAENIQRKNLSPIEEAEAFKSYVVNYGRGGITRLARRLGKSEEYVSHRLLLLGLPKSIVERISRRLLKPSIATEIMWLNESQQQTKLADEAVKNRLSLRETRQAVKFVRSQHLSPEDAVSKAINESRVQRTDAGGDQLEPWQGYESEADGKSEAIDVLDHATLIMRTCLVGLDTLVQKPLSPDLHELLLRQRQAVHTSLDEIISAGVMRKKTIQLSPRAIRR